MSVKYFLVTGMMFAAALFLAGLLSGCASWPLVAKTAVDVGECVGEEYSLVRDAIQDPDKAETWFSIAGQLLHCAPAVIRDLEALAASRASNAPSGVLVVSADGSHLYTGQVSLEARRRMRALKLLLRGLKDPEVDVK